MTIPGIDPSTQPAENTPEWFRSTIERQGALVKELQGKLRARTFEAVGIDTSKGLGKTMFETYEGDDDPNELKAWAAEKFEWSPTPANPVEGHTPEQIAAQAVVTETQGRVEAATANAQSTEPPPSGTIAELQAQIAAAESKGDFATSIALKRQWTQEAAKR